MTLSDLTNKTIDDFSMKEKTLMLLATVSIGSGVGFMGQSYLDAEFERINNMPPVELSEMDKHVLQVMALSFAEQGKNVIQEYSHAENQPKHVLSENGLNSDMLPSFIDRKPIVSKEYGELGHWVLANNTANQKTMEMFANEGGYEAVLGISSNKNASGYILEKVYTNAVAMNIDGQIDNEQKDKILRNLANHRNTTDSQRLVNSLIKGGDEITLITLMENSNIEMSDNQLELFSKVSKEKDYYLSLGKTIETLEKEKEDRVLFAEVDKKLGNKEAALFFEIKDYTSQDRVMEAIENGEIKFDNQKDYEDFFVVYDYEKRIKPGTLVKLDPRGSIELCEPSKLNEYKHERTTSVDKDIYGLSTEFWAQLQEQKSGITPDALEMLKASFGMIEATKEARSQKENITVAINHTRPNISSPRR